MRQSPETHEAMLTQLRTLPFVRGLTLRAKRVTLTKWGPDATLVVQTPTGKRQFFVETIRSHLTHAVAARLVGQLKTQDANRWLVFAPYIPGPMGRFLAAEGVNFLDAVGNCSIALDQRYIARIEGRRPERATEQAGLRAAAYQVLFVLLAGEANLNATVRVLADLAGVGKSTVAQTLLRLDAEGFIGRQGRRKQLLNTKRLLDRWLGGYAEVLRPRWLQGRYQVADLDAFERQLPAKLKSTAPWGWSGGAAAMRLTGHYRGDETALCLWPSSVTPRELGLLADRSGPVSLFGLEGALAFDGAKPQTVHPLLVYGELLARPSDRAAEAAEEVRARWLPWLCA